MLIKGYFIGLLALSASMLAHADTRLYQIRSKDVGWNTIDLTITETRREARISYLNIPRYRNRTSVESRFAMCAFTDIALRRDFQVWIVADGSLSGDKVEVGFLKTEEEDVKTTLGERFAGPQVLRATVKVVNRMCGIRERPR